MNKDFIHQLFAHHRQTEWMPVSSVVQEFTTGILDGLFPAISERRFRNENELTLFLESLYIQLESILDSMQEKLSHSPTVLVHLFREQLPIIYETLCTDIQAILTGDPAASNEYEVVRAYPGFYAIAMYRIAHALHQLSIPLLPRIITEFAHSRTGIDINPAAQIGKYFFIDHGTGVVVGETCVIGNNVKLYQCVTLGALSVSKEMAGKKRHPTIEDNVVIYSGATILGGDTVIGHDSVIGGNVWLTKTVPPFTTVYHQEQVKVSNPEGKSAPHFQQFKSFF
jgi:serine O-acetyltransferase